MNKRLKKILVSTFVMGIMLIPSISASAREIGSFAEFDIPKFQGVVSTGYLKKAISDAPYVMNITRTISVGQIDTYLANTDGVRRSDYARVGRGRSEINSSGKEGYSYKAIMMNSVSTALEGSVTGSWSPDNK